MLLYSGELYRAIMALLLLYSCCVFVCAVCDFKNKSPIFVLLCALCFQMQRFFIFILIVSSSLILLSISVP